MNLKELAALMGLSPTTVSRALGGYPEVNAATRERVLAAAKRHNYQPNSRAIRLATGRAMAVGHVIPVATHHEIMNPVFADFIAGAGEIYARHDHDMLLSIVPNEGEIDAYRAMKAKGNVDGVILHSPGRNDPRIAFLREIGLPFVVHGRSSEVEQPYAWVDVNNRRAFQRACDFLLDLGHRRIALINGLEFMDFAYRRRSGYQLALTERGVPLDEALMVADEMTEVSGYRAAKRMLDLAAPPSAFLASSMISGMGIRRAIHERGLVMGRDISVIIHDDDLSYMRNGEDVPIFTATRSSVREAGKIAAEFLLGQIAEPDAPLKTRQLEAELVIGRSTGPVSP